MARHFYYDNGSEKIGPVSGEELVELRAQGRINDETWVRRDDNGTWRPLGTVDLSAEEDEVANPSLWTILCRSGLIWPAILLGLGIIAVIVVLTGIVTVFWPVFLFGLFIWFMLQLGASFWRR